MDKIKKPKKMSELLNANVTRAKRSEKYIMPKNEEDFDKQQSDRFRASSNNFSEWNMEFRKEVYNLEPEIFDRWKENYGEALLQNWKKGLTPKETAVIIAKMFSTGSSLKREKKKH